MTRLATVAALATCGALLAMAHPARAEVVITVNKATQRMSVVVNGHTRYVWSVSTGRRGFGTPNGVYRPQMLARRWFSKKYYNSPMPHSIFFHKGYAIHGTTHLAALGGVASHGCVRLHPSHAAALFGLVQSQGSGNTRIVIAGANAGAQKLSRRISAKPRAVANARPAPVPPPAVDLRGALDPAKTAGDI